MQSQFATNCIEKRIFKCVGALLFHQIVNINFIITNLTNLLNLLYKKNALRFQQIKIIPSRFHQSRDVYKFWFHSLNINVFWDQVLI